ncbi:hypothetical protein SETIT_2G112900v2 [Setaria italica]|uniref:Poly [ADP-ribose] polymerase n=1 Tax=Setaria italica TaxID=4555 RepID=A0A368PXV9_SETIT|nr:hypothetical protein SETIT_2G112900v2 [Setaria italica]
MAAPPKAWKAEYAKSGRASCKSCRSPIAKDQLRLGKMVQATQFDGFMPMWNHARCIFGKKNQIKSVDDVEGIDTLRWDDQEKIRNYVESASAATSSTATVPDKCTIDVAPSARTSCRRCSQKITKGTVRVSAKLEGQASKGIPWYHVNCFLEVSISATVEKFSGWDTLSDEDKRTVLDLVKKDVGHNEPTKGSKRKKGENDMQSCKAPKLDESTSEGTVRNKGKLVDPRDSNASSADIQQKLKEQSDTLWKLKDELTKHLSTAELRDMLEANEQDTSGPERLLLDRWRLKIPIVREDYIGECIRKNRTLPFDLYKVENTLESKGGTVTVKVKGRSAVHESSGLQDTAHILEDGKSIYNTTLNMSDLARGVNSYYVLQVIEEDDGSECYVFRKWGRVGNERIGSQKLEEMSKTDAIQEFKRLFLEKTGNPWEAWERKTNFQKQPGRFYPLDIDYGVKQAPKRKDISETKSSLAPQLLELMKMLFNVETYRAAMTEFEINMSEMPLGKLSKENIQKGFEALTEIQNLLKNTADQALAVRESLIVAASNRFFTLIPSIHPHIIRDEDEIMIKAKMLEALQDIEIASKLVGFDSDNDESLDDKYMKLHCNIAPLPHDSEDYKLVERYLLNTHAPTHKDWSLELEEVFSLDRDGELNKYSRYKNNLHNKMLLWHGSRLTNFVGILSQGLRIAPPEAPVTGYMFGKGLYFADLVSKSAQYCYVDRGNPVGLMLLSEVALGDMYELKKATSMDKPPRGKHSTKGLGKTVPLESEFVNWRDDVVVPCGKPVPSSVRSSELLYNEYIVYNTSQVKMQFLLKVRFHHKR